MSNILNSILANRPINKPSKEVSLPAFSFDAEGKIKPLDDKAKLLPSKIFGSPAEYAKDLKQDVLSIGRAAKGKANDHELGRLNDLAMKLGSLGLATYLFVKTPGKLAKAMEFVGFGTFFASMALWPKLAIQAPIKARTGVDIHQKYIDSQNRKKMLHQDPQYDLTDLYFREDLDKIGKKLNVSENLPDRDSFIKQRAKKTATQGNTLWMMTAGVATPVMSALACNALEKPLASAIEKVDMATTESAIKKLGETGQAGGFIEKIRQHFATKSLNKFLTQNADRVVDADMATKIAELVGKTTNSPSLQTAIAQQVKSLGSAAKLDKSLVREALKDLIAKGAISDTLIDALPDVLESPKQVANLLSGKNHKLNGRISSELNKALSTKRAPKVSDIADGVRSIHTSLRDFASGKRVLDRYVAVRIGENADSYVAHQWTKVTDTLVKKLKFSSKELKQLSRGNIDVLTRKLSALASNPEEYNRVVSELIGMAIDYESKLGSSFTSKVQQQSRNLSKKASEALSKVDGVDDLIRKFEHKRTNGSVGSVTGNFMKERIAGAQSSFYRILQTLDFFKRAGSPEMRNQIKTLLQNMGKAADDVQISKYIELAKKILLESTSTSFVEKLQTTGFENILRDGGVVSPDDYKVVMEILFGSKSGSTLRDALGDKADDLLRGFNSYTDDVVQKLANAKSPMKPEFERYVATGKATAGKLDPSKTGKRITSLFRESAGKAYNSNKWLKIFGGTMIALTAATLTAGLLIGRKSKGEKQAEKESRING